jgi:predicted unusual protein kinase regulating ubiquinone biosynthesis (AarF/ABC1/UbiB family)
LSTLCTESPNIYEFDHKKKSIEAAFTMMSLQEVKDATEWFSKNYLLGEGSFGPVYYGKLATGQEVVVKVKKTVY